MRSDAYTIVFTTIITVILGLGLSYTADSLRERQILNEELDIKPYDILVTALAASIVCLIICSPEAP